MTDETDNQAAGTSDDEALHATLRRLLAPLAKLAVSQGMPHATMDACLRSALVEQAYDAHPDLPAHRRASRVSAATGIHRREVQRLLSERDHPVAPARSVTVELFTHWIGDGLYRDAKGSPKPLPRVGAAPSFESLAHTITRDVHPRTLLEELLRLKLANWDTTLDTVTIVTEGFVPRHDKKQMLGFLGNNVGDHLSAAVSNVIGEGDRHFEQALFAEGLSDQSLAEYKDLATAQWRHLTQSLVPALEQMLERDKKAVAAGNTHRIRLGLYSFNESTPSPPAAPNVSPAAMDALTESMAAKPRAKRRPRSKGTS